MKTVTLAQIVAKLATVNSPQPFGLSALTEPKLAKPAPFQIRKLSKVCGFIGDWEGMVNNQLAREGKPAAFVAKSRKWGKHVSLALVEHKGGFYLATKAKQGSPIYLVKRSPLSPWQIVAKAIVAPFLAESQASDVGTDKPLYPRDYSLANVARLSLGGETYRIRH